MSGGAGAGAQQCLAPGPGAGGHRHGAAVHRAVLPVSLWKTSSVARKGSSPSSSSSGQPWWLGDRRDLPEGLSWEVPGEAALEPAPSFPWLQVPGGFGGALCSPVPSPRTGNSSGNGQDVSSSRVSGRPCLWLCLSLLSFAFEAA